VRVIPNKYPALEIDLSFNRTGEGIYDRDERKWARMR